MPYFLFHSASRRFFERPPVVWGMSLTVLLILAGCAKKEPATFAGKNVLLVSIDTCRADHVQPYSDGHAQTPVLKSIAQDGLWFADAVSPVPLTLPAHCSLLTGLHPIRHGVRNNYNYALSDEAVTLAELFQESGYATAGAIGAILISRREGLSQGFEYYNDEFSLEEYQAMQPAVERRAEKVVASATAWLQSHLEKLPEKPFFLFVHFYDPHMVYQPPAPFDSQYADSPYDGEIAYVDRCLGQLTAYLRDRGLYEDLLIVLVGDHGEGLGDHQELNHGLFLYEETVRVPFIVKLPQGAIRDPGRACQQSAGLEDVTPTLIELCGLGPTPVTGISLVPWLLGSAVIEPRDIVLETQYPLTYNWSPLYALRNADWKYIHAPIPELYRLADDPGETKNQTDSNSALKTEMSSELEDRLIALARDASLSAVLPVSSDRMEMLASLGYAAGGAAPGIIGPDKSLPDPKQKIDVYLLIDRGLGALARGFHQRSIELFEQAMRKDPQNPTAYANMGLAYAQMKEWDAAIKLTKKAVELSPENLLAHLQLTRIYTMSGHLEEGQNWLEAILRDFPKQAEAHYQLGEIYLRQQDYSKALQQFQEAKRWMPDMPGIDSKIEQAEMQK